MTRAEQQPVIVSICIAHHSLMC